MEDSGNHQRVLVVSQLIADGEPAVATPLVFLPLRGIADLE